MSVSDKSMCAKQGDKSAARLPRTSENFDWASEFLVYLYRNLYTVYRENGELRSFLRNCCLLGM